MKRNYLILTLLTIVFIYNSCEELINNELTSSEIAQKLEGQWQCNEQSSQFKSTDDYYSVYITLSETDSTKVFISNIYQLGNEIEAYAKIDKQTITIPRQIVDGYTINGSGTISSNLREITWQQYVDDGSGIIDEIDAVYTFQY